MAMGERSPVALVDAPASGRMAIGEALTNLASAPIRRLGEVKLSANWMAAAGEAGEDAALYATVEAVSLALCPALGVAIPVGKDSLSMKTVWRHEGAERVMTAPITLVVSAFAPVVDVRRALTPQLQTEAGPTVVLFVDLGRGRNRLGGSALAQVYGEIGSVAPDLDDPSLFRGFFAAIQQLNTDRLLLAYHDRSDGGLFACLCEMAFAGHCGIDVEVGSLGEQAAAALFAEELGAALQVRVRDVVRVVRTLEQHGLAEHTHAVGIPEVGGERITLRRGGREIFSELRTRLHRAWAETSYQMQSLRDHPACAREQYDEILDGRHLGLACAVGFDLHADPAAPFIAKGVRPSVAILREQGVNGHLEMAAAFDRAGFACVDVHMSDLVEGRVQLEAFVGLAACGGFSYGDVLGAGAGWAKSILFNARLCEQFARYFRRGDRFALGVCNGCQMLSQLRELIPGSHHWPRFVRNRSEQFEGRLSLVEVCASPSLFLSGMEGSRLPVAVAHAEGRVAFDGREDLAGAVRDGLVALRFVHADGTAAGRYPANPNGSPAGITGLCNRDGRVTILMPHPERGFRSVQYSWHPPEWGEDGPWLRMFRNARAWVS